MWTALIPRVACALALLWSAAPGAAQAADAQGWLPLEPGHRWVYRTHRDITLRPKGSQSRRLFYEGRSEEILERSPAEDAPAGRRVRSTTTERGLSPGLPQSPRTEQSLRYLSRGSSGLQLHAVVWPGADPNTPADTRYDPPLRLLDDSQAAGHTWTVGTLRQDALRGKLTGKVVGREDVDVRGTTYQDCLVVRHAGELSSEGAVTVAGETGSVREGRYEQRTWFKQGVGIVKEVTDYQVQLKTQDDGETQLSVVTTRTLEDHEPAS